MTVAGVLRFLVRNWPLKLAAVALATLLYAGLVVSQNTQVFSGSIPIVKLGQAEDVQVLDNLGAVDRIRYYAPADVRVDSTSFEATVDLSGVNPDVSAGVVLDVRVRAIDPRITVIDYDPATVNVRIERVIEKVVPVEVKILDVAAGLDVREPLVTPDVVTVRGPASVVQLVVRGEARVQIDPSGIDIDREVEVIPVDVLGEALSPTRVEPETVRVRVAVFTDLQTKSLPITPVVTGTPAAGFELAKISVQPLIVSVEGDADQLALMDRVDTRPISISGATSDRTLEVELDLPTGVLPLGVATVQVTVTLRPVTATRTFTAGLSLRGAQGDLTYVLATDRVLLTVGGPVGELDRLSGANLTAILDVTGFAAGLRLAQVQVDLPIGLTLVGASPSGVSVTISGPPATPTPSLTPPPSPTPTPGP